MRVNSAQPDARSRTNAATSASSIVALMALAMAVSAVQGGVPVNQYDRTPVVREASAARAVAAAVTAAVRDMVVRDSIDTSVACECTDPLACRPSPATVATARDDAGRSHAPPIAPHLINIPPPAKN